MAFNLFQGIRMPKNGQDPPSSLSWKAAVSAPKSRVCVLLQCSSSWFTTSGWQGFRRCGLLSLHLHIPAFALLHAENQRG